MVEDLFFVLFCFCSSFVFFLREIIKNNKISITIHYNSWVTLSISAASSLRNSKILKNKKNIESVSQYKNILDHMQAKLCPHQVIRKRKSKLSLHYPSHTHTHTHTHHTPHIHTHTHTHTHHSGVVINQKSISNNNNNNPPAN